ncbi:phosphoribosylanthranilate isomerase [Bacillus sp. 03113]|uniref:phosphoribosylanthranilate isomerase n=1 Tax=Bacillus sp. 03113 TaxID=2578211 RepID=UPI0011422CBA|nr:phosphoribosylanthranilate isomerase [Bacillus sp. 03113]
MDAKVCGIKDIETAVYTANKGAKAIGFVFAESKRRISPAQAAEIIKELPDQILKVGVFVNESKETIERIIEETGINAVQLHGEESPSFCEAFSVPVIKAFSVGKKEDLEIIRDYTCEYILLDSPKGQYRGGNGISFDWSILKGNDFKGKKLILAGGLNEQNVLTAIQEVHPYMVDVSSGVETNGVKDLNKIDGFLSIVRDAEKKEDIS